MEFLSYVVLLLLSLAGYSAGTAGGAGKRRLINPLLGDLLAVCLIWAGALWTRAGWGWNKWMSLPVWTAVAAAAGLILVRLRIAAGRLPVEETGMSLKEEKTSLGKKWKNFSHRMGSFQSRVLLSLFYFIVVFPFAFMVRLFSDPLKIKRRKEESFWGERKYRPGQTIQDFRRQF